MRLLLLEDDRTLGAGLRDFLQHDGYLVDWCTTLAQAKGLISEPYDAWLLDWNLPDGSALEWLRGLRTRGARTPALVLTARDLLSDRIHGLDSGADDFLVKPFAPEELSARLRALSRRITGGTPRKIFGRVEISLSNKDAWLDGQRVELTAREWAVLEALILRTGRTVSATELESLVLGLDSELASNALQVHIFKLRSKLGKEMIQTVRGMGYMIPNPVQTS
ncbi:response regulator transcription factor [Acidovorax sp. LjRoot118]|uniref:winged helix-turn-helix domain-containing protein n=1 Tax=unclassified Acidovorax TaxID=2684926 RepID=UPI00071071EF|nr:response regulator transcription factor [Acidovorax sp. Root219]KRC36051.1 two-component system response regulator [Acidovorax sp. Root219]